MKKIWICLVLATIAGGLTGCEKFLEENPHDRIVADEAFESVNDLYLNAVAAIYRDLGGNSNGQGLQGTGHGVYDLNTFTTDEAIMPTRGADWYDGGYWQALYLHRFGQADGTGDAWNYLMKEVLACNGSLERIELYGQQHKDKVDEVEAYRAEVRALRAMFLFYAMDLYGRVPLFETSSPTAAQMKLRPRSEAYRYIVDELQQVLLMLIPARTNQPGEFYGRMSQGAAAFLLAKLMLNAEVYADDDWTDATRPDGKNIKWNVLGEEMNTWEAVIFYCDLLANDYRLEGDFITNFSVNNETSTENIFTIPMDKYLYDTQYIYLFRSRHYNHAAAMGLNGENGTSATLEALETFGLQRDGTVDNIDPRFYVTYYSGEVLDLAGNPVLLDDGTPLVYEPWAVALDVSGTPHEKTAGARMAKYEVDPKGTKDGKQSDNDIVLFRFADVLLMKAEALLRNGQDGSEPFNAVRARVWAPKRPCTLDNVLAERMLELAWEGWRRNDLIRFGRFGQARSFRPQLEADVKGYTTVFPIPGETLAVSGSDQNPGY